MIHICQNNRQLILKQQYTLNVYKLNESIYEQFEV